MVFKNYSQKNRPINPRDTMQPDRGIIAFFSRHKVAANLLMAILILYGAFGITQLKRQLMPDFGLELISVDVEWQGASAEDIARTCHAHPTFSEAVKEAALSVDKRAIHS